MNTGVPDITDMFAGGSVNRTFENAGEVLELYGPVLRTLASAAGPHVEVVLHNLDGSDVDLDHTIMAITNGHVTGRKVGGPSTSLGLDVMRDRQGEQNAFGFSATTSDGRPLRCSSMYFRNDEGSIIASLCVNVDLSPLQNAKLALQALMPDERTGASPREHFGTDLVTVMDAMITEVITDIGVPVTQMTRDDKILVLQRLDQRGATQMRKSVEAIAKRLGISRVTAYSYLEQAKSAE
ncbi:helix-turn-helix transcriptional regulator [Microbacterium sp. YY-03]|uniref:helix-turn-helix transcriptional regulator n=1 Tax=Microbacterium sp. YY-03 TaxID=3421636 RepID=UPI003D172BD0